MVKVYKYLLFHNNVPFPEFRESGDLRPNKFTGTYIEIKIEIEIKTYVHTHTCTCVFKFVHVFVYIRVYVYYVYVVQTLHMITLSST